MTTLGVIGLGRIGAFHTDTLSGLDGIDGLVITDERPEWSPPSRPNTVPSQSIRSRHCSRPGSTVSSSPPRRPPMPS